MEGGGASRGYELLLAHCEVRETPDAERADSFERLTDSIGGGLARLLVSALSGDPGVQPPADPHQTGAPRGGALTLRLGLCAQRSPRRGRSGQLVAGPVFAVVADDEE